jgi:integrase
MSSAPDAARPAGARKALQQAEAATVDREGRKSVELPHIVTHDLRHFFASALSAGGASVKQVQLTRPRVRRHHAADLRHLWPGEEDRTRTVMDAVLGGLRTGCGPEDQTTKEIAGQTA